MTERRLKLMTKFGALELKKPSKIVSLRTVFAVCCLSALFFASSCKSVENAIPEIDALSILEEDSAVYFRIPVAKHSDFVKKMLCNTVSGLTEDNADMLIPKIDVICAGIGSKDDLNRVQLSASGYIPPIALKAVLTEKNGWKTKTSSVKSSLTKGLVPFVSYERSDTSYLLGLPSLKNMVFAEDVTPLFERYNEQYDAVSDTGIVKVPSDTWTSNTYEWMTQSSDDIRFCVLRPQAFLAALLGTEMRLALVCARGSFAENEDGSFNLSLELEFENMLVVKAAQVMLKLAFGQKVSMSQTDENILKLANIHFTQEAVLKLFGQQINN